MSNHIWIKTIVIAFLKYTKKLFSIVIYRFLNNMFSKVLKLHLITPIKTNQSILYYFQDPNRSIFGRLQVQQMRGKGELILPQRVLFGELLRELLELPPRSECERRAYCPIEANKAQSSHLNRSVPFLFFYFSHRIFNSCCLIYPNLL